jgi:hypothetical protein
MTTSTLVLLAAGALLLWAILIFNLLVRDRNRVRAGWADIDVQLKRRHDLIPELARAVGGYAKYEQATLKALTELRARSLATGDPGRKGPVEREIGDGLHRLIALVERYPDLKANEQFMALQRSLVEVEDHIQYARRYYNGTVRNLNTRIEQFPDMLVARTLAFRPAAFFQVEDDDERRAPAVGSLTGALAVLTLAAGLFAVGPARADERILDYHGDVAVQADGSMRVEETIRVRAEGNNIRRGIYRDFPTDYEDRLGQRYRVAFDVIAVRRDGAAEPWHSERQGNGVRVYAGSSDVFLKPGEYTYTFVYRTDRQLGFFDKHDELYWNVTGNGWAFVIDRASAAVRLPEGVPREAITVEAYTGPQGAKGRDYRAWVDEAGAARFETTLALGPGEGLTIVTGWPKGFVHEPTQAEQFGYVLRDNRSVLAGLLGLGLLLVYYYVVWRRVGRDPEPGVIFPHYEPPKGYTPAAVRFIRRMGYDHKAFAAAVVNLAVNGALSIEQSKGGTYTLKLTGHAPERRGPGEKVLMTNLFEGSESIKLSTTNHARVSKAIDAHKRALKLNYEKNYFMTNRSWLVPGAAITFLILLVGVLLSPAPGAPAGLFILIWLIPWTLGLSAVLKAVVTSIRGAEGLNKVGAIVFSLVAIPFVVGTAAGLFAFAQITSVSLAFILLAALFVNYLFYEWLKAPTLAGRRLLDQVEGFGLYLGVAEKDEIARQGAPRETTDLFERYLPYALAMDLENEWAQRFAALFTGLHERGESYQPGWYSGRNWNSLNVQRFTSAVGSSLGAAIASSSTRPGSSSGGGGGGSSGGGGGGGGGGGW